MKKLAYITMVAALIFGVQSAWATTSIVNNNGEGPTTSALPSGNVSLQFDEEQQQLTITMATAGDRERVTVQMASSRGQIVTKEVMIVDGRGSDLKIDMRDMDPGTFYVKVSSKSIKFAKKFSTKR